MRGGGRCASPGRTGPCHTMDMDKLLKILGMTGSSHDGEALAARRITGLILGMVGVALVVVSAAVVVANSATSLITSA